MTAKNFLTRTQLGELVSRAQNYAALSEKDEEHAAAVGAYISEIVELVTPPHTFDRLIECGLPREEFEHFLLNGAKSWTQYSAGGCSLIATEDVIARVGEPEIPSWKRFTYEDERDVERARMAMRLQAAYLSCAAGYLFEAYTDLRTECRQFYIVRSSRNARRVGGYIERYSVFEHVANTDKSVPLSTQMIRVAEFKLYTSAYRGEEHEAAAALVKAGKLPAEVLTPSGYFDKDNYGEYSGLCAYCTFETLPL